MAPMGRRTLSRPPRDGILLAYLLVPSTAAHLITRSCGLFLGRESSNRAGVLIDYHWGTSPRTMPGTTNFSIRHHREWAQSNHVCPANQYSLISRVRLTVDGAHSCSCQRNVSGAACKSHADMRKRGGWDGVTNTTRLFIGDSRMSGEARIYAHMLQQRCRQHASGGAYAFHRSTDYGAPVSPTKMLRFTAHRKNFAVWCESMGAWALYVRVNRLEGGWPETLSAIRALLIDDKLFADVSTPWRDSDAIRRLPAAPLDTSTAHVEIIFGTYVWDIIDRGGFDVGAFLSESIEESGVASFYAAARGSLPSACFVLRGAPPSIPPSTTALQRRGLTNLPGDSATIWRSYTTRRIHGRPRSEHSPRGTASTFSMPISSSTSTTRRSVRSSPPSEPASELCTATLGTRVSPPCQRRT